MFSSSYQCPAMPQKLEAHETNAILYNATQRSTVTVIWHNHGIVVRLLRQVTNTKFPHDLASGTRFAAI
jgi:hypothetical protein